MDSQAYAAARRKRVHQVTIGLLLLVTLAVYWNSFQAGFPQDNQKMILLDSRITALNNNNLEMIFTHGYWYPIETSGLYRPATTISYLFNYTVLGNGDRPFGYHLINLLLQCLNVTLIYLLAWNVFADYGVAIATAAIWSVHPLLTESVTNIIGRADLLAGAAIVLALLLHTRSRSAGNTIFLSLVSTVGILSKENVATLPAIMAAYDLILRREGKKQYWTNYIAVGLPLLLSWWLRTRVLEPTRHPFVDNPLVAADFWTANLTVLKSVGQYLGLAAFPMRLSSDYSYNQIPLVRTLGDTSLWPAIVLCAMLLSLVIWCARRHEGLLFFLTFSALSFLPTSNLILRIGSIMADRFMYLPLVGYAACLAVGLISGTRFLGKPWIGALTITVLCAGLGIRAFARNYDWRDDETLARSSVAASPNSFKTHMYLARVLLTKHPPQTNDAVREADRMLQILSDLPDEKKVAIAYSLAGEIYRKIGDLEKSRDILLRGVQIDRMRNRENIIDSARRGLKQSDIRTIGYSDLYVQLGATFLALNEPARALEAFDYGRRLTPYNADFYGGAAKAYEAMHDSRRQVIALIEGATMLPMDRRIAALLPAAYTSIDTAGCQPVALDSVTGLLHVNLNCAIVHEHVCEARLNLVRMLADAKLRSLSGPLAQDSMNQVGCPAAQFDSGR